MFSSAGAPAFAGVGSVASVTSTFSGLKDVPPEPEQADIRTNAMAAQAEKKNLFTLSTTLFV
jgi:hypothetical protein